MATPLTVIIAKFLDFYIQNSTVHKYEIKVICKLPVLLLREPDLNSLNFSVFFRQLYSFVKTHFKIVVQISCTKAVLVISIVAFVQGFTSVTL